MKKFEELTVFYRCLPLFTLLYVIYYRYICFQMGLGIYKYYIISYYFVCCFDMRVKTL